MVGTILLSLLIAVALLYPFFAPPSEDTAQGENVLNDQKDRCIQVLKDLELDRATQKIEEEDYTTTRASLERELGTLLTRIDEEGK